MTEKLPHIDALRRKHLLPSLVKLVEDNKMLERAPDTKKLLLHWLEIEAKNKSVLEAITCFIEKYPREDVGKDIKESFSKLRNRETERLRQACITNHLIDYPDIMGRFLAFADLNNEAIKALVFNGKENRSKELVKTAIQEDSDLFGGCVTLASAVQALPNGPSKV